MGWPDWSVRLLAEFLAKEPAPPVRIEASVAQLAAIYANAHRRKGAAPHKVSDFLLFDDAWQPAEPAEKEESIADFALSFGVVKRHGNNHR
jgi:hypothetical protein